MVINIQVNLKARRSAIVDIYVDTLTEGSLPNAMHLLIDFFSVAIW